MDILSNFFSKETDQDNLAVRSIQKIFNQSPSVYKTITVCPDSLLVVGGIKATTDYYFPGDTWSYAEFKILQSVFKKEKLVLTNPLQALDKSRHCYLYNPKTLKQQTICSPYIMPYDGKTSIESYINTNISKGYEYGAVNGKLYSFPDSAINDFLTKESGLLEGKQQINISSDDELYWCFAPVQSDVDKREINKKKFLEKLRSTPEITHILNSPDLKRSTEEWQRRLPIEIK